MKILGTSTQRPTPHIWGALQTCRDEKRPQETSTSAPRPFVVHPKPLSLKKIYLETGLCIFRAFCGAVEEDVIENRDNWMLEYVLKGVEAFCGAP